MVVMDLAMVATADLQNAGDPFGISNWKRLLFPL